MTNVSAWSTAAGSNNGAPPAGAPEGMLPGKVNDVIREVMAALARWYATSRANLTSGGTGNAYTLTTGSGYTALADLPVLTFLVNRVNTGSITLNVDGLGALLVYRSVTNYDEFAANELREDQIAVVVYNSNGWFEYCGPLVEGIIGGTRMLFQQTAAPTGYTKDTSSHNNKALRLVTGTASSGGSTGFTSVFTSRTVALANLPVSSLSFSLSVGTSVNTNNGSNIVAGAGSSLTTVKEGTGSNHLNMREDLPALTNITSSLVSGAVSGSIALGGSGTAMDFAVQYADAIIATKD